jgi:hypothetical protein
VSLPADDRVSPITASSVPLPAWVRTSLSLQEGRDPLGLQTTTQDRLMPLLLPGVLELSRRARYFSFHAFLLSEYRGRGKPDRKILSAFIKRAEWDYGLAVQRCPKCPSSPIGARRLGTLAQESGPFPRGESVESPLGGYGLYYRSPLIAFGIVAGAGTLLGGEPTPIDLLYDTQRARQLADTFGAAVADTAYCRERYLWTTNPLPVDVVDEYATAACLCQLRTRPKERDAVHAALFAADPADEYIPTSSPATNTEVTLAGAGASAASMSDDDSETLAATATEMEPSSWQVIQRRRSVGHYLTLLEVDPKVTAFENAYREALWAPPPPRSVEHAVVAGQWSALIAKDVWQEALCSIWSQFCRDGLNRTHTLERGLGWQEVHELAYSLLHGPPALAPHLRTPELVAEIAAGTATLPSGTTRVAVSGCSLEKLSGMTKELDTAASGLFVLLELARRMAQRSGAGWERACRIESGWQPSVATVATALGAHLDTQPTVADTMWWVVARFVLPVHERIAYSKLPEFTFRFRWEDGLLRFYDLGVGRFPLAAIRKESFSQLTRDLDFWDDSTGLSRSAVLTDRGRAFIQETLT